MNNHVMRPVSAHDGEIPSVFNCPENKCSFGTDDLGLFIEHVSTISRKEFERKLIIDRNLVFTF